MKKLGKVKMSSEMVLDNPMDLLPIFTKFIPIHIERQLNYDDFIYTGVCEDFDDKKEGEEIPFYMCSVTQNEKYEITKVEFKKVNP